MSSHNDDIHKTQSVTAGTADPNQQQVEGDVVLMKDGIPSDLTSSVSSSEDVTAGFTGEADKESGTIMGVNGTGYFEGPGVNVSGTLPCCSSLSTSVHVQNETVNGSVIAESNPNHSGLAKPDSLKSTDRNGSLTRKLLKAVADTKRDIKMLNKASHLHSNFTAASLPKTYNQKGKSSSVANPRCHAFPPANDRTKRTVSSVNDTPAFPPAIYRTNGTVSSENERHAFSPANYRTNGTVSSVNDRHAFPPANYGKNRTVSSVNDRFLSTDKLMSTESEMSMELTRGPRGHYNNFPLQSSATKDDFAITICRDKYNLSDFQTEYETAKFYVIKSFNEDDIHKSIKYDVWTSTPNGNKKLNAAFVDAEAKLIQTGMKCPLFLFFSVNASRQFVGVAEMLGPVDFEKDMKFWKLDKYNGFFPIRWHIIKDVPNNQFCHIILESNENRPVTFTRDTQEIGLKQGLEMLNIFKSYSAKTSLLDDFDFYEKREKLLRSGRSSKNTIPEPEVYGYETIPEPEVYGYDAIPEPEVYSYDNYQSTVRAGEKRIGKQSYGTKQDALVNLTKNLSLNPSGKQGFK